MNYSLASGLASGETLTFKGLMFASEASEWWITGADGAAITAPLSSVAPDESSKAMLNQSDLPDGFTYSIGANAGVAREIALEIQIAAVAGEAPLTTLPFTLTQDGTTLGALATIEDTISADGATDATYIFKGLVLNSGTYWWITGENGGAISGLTHVTPDNENKRAHDGDKSFTYTSSDNTGPGNSDIDINLEIQIAPSAGADATITLDFTLTQSKPLISAVGSNDGIASADPGTYTVTFFNRMFATGTTHWWVTGSGTDRSLPAGVSVTADAESKALASVATFDMTVPENLTTAPQTFTLLLHAGTSGLAEAPSLHAETFDVVQAGKLVTLGDDTYEIDAGAQATAEVDFESQLSLRSDMTHWWITAAGGSAANTITGITSVSHHFGNKQDKGTNSFTMNVSQNPTIEDRDFMLELHVGTSSGNSQGSVPFTVTQEGTAVTLSTANYDILPAANPSVSIDFEGLEFKSEINYWWVTAANGDAASTIEGVTGVSHDGSTVSKSLATSTTSFTMNVAANPTRADRDFALALHAGESAGTSQGSVPFTVTQNGHAVTLSDDTYEIAAEANSSAEVNFGNNVQFQTLITHWWVTAANGDAARTIEGITSVSHDGTGSNRQAIATKSFTINVTKNPLGVDRVFMLALQVGGSSGASQGSVPFTVTQEENEAVTLRITNYNIPADANTSAGVNFNGVEFTGVTHLWVTGRNGPASDISGITSVSHDGSPGKRQGGAAAFTINVTQNPTTEDRVFMLTLHAGGSTGDPEGSVHFTVTQEASPAVTLSKTNYSIPEDADNNARVNFGSNAQFHTGITDWWVTARNGSAASTIDGITSVSHNFGNRQTKGTNSFTINVSQNPNETDRVFMLTLHAGGSSGASQGSVPFTVTQAGTVITLSQTNYSIPADANTRARVNFGSNVEFPGGITDWWVTARDGSAANTIDGITSVSHDGTNARRGIGTPLFTINVTKNPTFADRVFMLTLHAGGSSGSSQASVPFTVTQKGSEPELISVSTLEQLNAIRYDLDGDGKVSPANATYTTAFAGLVSSNLYIGYKLTKNLNFTNDNSYSNTSNKSGWTSGSGWSPIGTFTGTFDGGGYKISNLHINRTATGANIGLFSQVNGHIRNVGLENPNVTGGTNARVGSLVGRQSGGTIRNCYVSGGSNTGGSTSLVGGLVGHQSGSTISTCYVKGGSNTGGSGVDVGGLVGFHQSGTIRACYVFNRSLSGGSGADIGSLIGLLHSAGKVNASYAGGKNYTKLIGRGSGDIKNSYYRTGTSGGRGKTQSQLRAPTNTNAYDSGSIYERWNLNLDGNAATKDPWDFGNSGQYPVLKGIDANADGTINAADLAEQRK